MQNDKRLEILGLLQSDARISAEQIAVMVGLPLEEVARLIAEMEEQRVILRYHTLVDWEKTGVENVVARIDVKITPQRDHGFDKLADRIARFPEVRSCYLMSGDYDLSLEVQAPNLREVSRFVSERLATLEGVASTTTHFVLKRYKHDGVLFGETEDGDERLAVSP